MGTEPSQLSVQEGREETRQLVVFSLAGCECAVGIEEVREIDRMIDLTRVPRAPRFVRGVFNLRGRVVPVLDLRKRFDMPLMEVSEESRILIAETGGQWIGIQVDRVAGVLRVPPASILPVEGPVLTVDPGALKGQVSRDGRLILVLALEKLAVLDAALSPSGEEGGENLIAGR